MTDWIDFTVYVIFLGALWFAQPLTGRRLRLPTLRDRNAAWVQAHPELVQRITGRRWWMWLSFALGTVSLAMLTAFQLGLWHPAVMHAPGQPAAPGWMILWQLSMQSMVAAIVIGGSIGLVNHVRLARLVPLAPQRHATLQPRSLDDHVPRPIQYLAYALALANIAAWIVAGILGTHSSPIFWPRVATMIVLSGFFYWATGIAVHRRPNIMDRIYGPDYRPWEVRLTFSTQFLPPIIGALRLYEEVNHVFLFDMSRATQLFLALYISAMMLGIYLLPIDRGPTSFGRPAAASRS